MGGCHNAIGFEIRDLIYCRAITVSGLAFAFCYVVTCSVLAGGRKTGFAWERVQLSESCISFDQFHNQPIYIYTYTFIYTCIYIVYSAHSGQGVPEHLPLSMDL